MDKADLISRKAAIAFANDQIEKETGAYSKGRNTGIRVMKSALNNPDAIPSVDAVPAVHGRWVDEDFPDKPATYVTPAICSVCGKMAHKMEHGYNIISKYCPNCGAKMDGNGE